MRVLLCVVSPVNLVMEVVVIVKMAVVDVMVAELEAEVVSGGDVVRCF